MTLAIGTHTQQMNAPSDQGSAKTVDVSQSVRLDVSGANEEAELIYLLTLGISHHPNYLPRHITCQRRAEAL